MNGLINLYKPTGMSSAQAVGAAKRILGEKTVGHMGTLDPMAQGVLVLGVGKSARLFDYLLDKRKSYIAKFTFGYETDTLDALGTVVAETNDIPSIDAVQGAMRSLVGSYEQIPPVYSAKHVDGKRAYKIARGGGNVELKPVKVTVFDACLISLPKINEAVFRIDCSAGTYIRSICRDVAKLCGSLATLTFLERTASGAFKSENSITLEKLEYERANALIPPQDVIELPKYEAPSQRYDDLTHGRKIEYPNICGDVAVYCRNEFFGIGTRASADGSLKIKTYLKDG